MYETIIKIDPVSAVNGDVVVVLKISIREIKTPIDPDAIVYRYVFPHGKSYVGRTKNPDKRKKQHIYYQAKAQANGKYPKESCIAFYAAVEKYGWNTITYEVLKHCKQSESSEIEDQMMAKYNSKVPNGYNLRSSGKIVAWSEESKLQHSEACRKGVLNNIDSFRTWTELNGMPPYIGCRDDGEKMGYQIRDHPHCKFVSFLHNYILSGPVPWVELKEETLKFYSTLPSITDKTAIGHKSVQTLRKEKGIMKGVRMGKDDITAMFEKIVNKKTYSATFSGGDRATNILCVEAYITLLIIKVALPKVIAKQECSSETKWQSAYPENIRKIVLGRLKI